MRRKVVISSALAACVLAMVAVSVEAQRGRRGARQARAATAQQPQTAPQSAAIAEALGELRWGMEPREVHAHFQRVIEGRYRERIQKAPGAIEEDRIRAEMNQEIRRLRESYVRFEGERTGWDVSFLRGEFTHGNRESMLVYRDGNSQNFYLFIRGRLWKWYKAFDATVFQGQSFEGFANAIQGRFGRAVERTGRIVEGGPEHRWLEWQDRTTRLRAVDQTRFYGFYCLVFEDKDTLGRLDELRTNRDQGSRDGHALVDSIVMPEGGEESGGNPNADIVDRITGTRRSQPAQAQQPQQQQGGARQAPRQQQRSQPSSGGGGLDLSDL